LKEGNTSRIQSVQHFGVFLRSPVFTSRLQQYAGLGPSDIHELIDECNGGRG
ncbi:unnamed protein product, partial [Allacma fusca]